MPASRIVRAVVRSFPGAELRKAAAHVRQGGHAIVWETPSRARLIVPAPDPANESDLALFAILDLSKTRYEISNEGVTKGLAMTRVPTDCNDLVHRRVERDKVHAGATRRVTLDCLACGACCHANKVELSKQDIARFEKAGRGDLLRMPYSRRQDGKLVLRLTGANKACQHLASDNKCGLYEIRPDMCREFPMASECCLSARAEELGIYDGATPA